MLTCMASRTPKCERKGVTLGGAKPKHSQTLLTCRVCGCKWCWECALRFGRAFGPSHPNSGWRLPSGKGDPRYLCFTCVSCAFKPPTPDHRKEHL
jgi:hypothetical protein